MIEKLKKTFHPDKNYQKTAWLFTKAFALISIIAFVSAWSQITGLLGSEGILPAKDFLKTAQEIYPGVDRFFFIPSLYWIFPSDFFLHVICSLGMFSGLMLLFGIYPRVFAILNCLSYLSIVSIGSSFFTYQWDTLLIEVGFLLIFIVPWKQKIGFKQSHPTAFCWILLGRLILIKVILGSGIVKFMGIDPSWKNLSAMTYHYFTQPLPNPFSWYLHQLPFWFDQASTAFVAFTQLLCPLLLFLSASRVRRFALGCIILTQILIILSGNHAFYNYLTLALTIFYFTENDLSFLKWQTQETASSKPFWIYPRASFFLVLLFLNLMIFGTYFSMIQKPPRWLGDTVHWSRILKISNTYGAFGHMTKERLEIIIEGSNDGKTWQAYEFHHKPGNLKSRPSFVSPLQPRLDWQMWFASLGDFYNQIWLQHFLVGLFEDKESILNLLKHNPFKDLPPKYIRCQAYLYEFTDFAEYNKTKKIWKRTFSHAYSPTLTLNPDSIRVHQKLQKVRLKISPN